jgi:hypothetical protein
MQTETHVEGKRKVRGRKDEQKQEQVTQPGIVKEHINELVKLYAASGESATALSDAIKVAAEKSGYNASAVKRFVVARAGEKFAEAKRLAEQQMELFEEVGE